MSGPLVLVLADSLAFHGPDRPEPMCEPRLWPNVAAQHLGGRAEVFARFGWSTRDAWWTLVGDPRIWSLIPRIDAVLLAVGGMDTLPSPLPTFLREGLRYLRPDGLRRRVREAYLAAHPALCAALRWTPGGRPVVLPAHLTVRYLEDCRRTLHILRPGIPVIGMVPAVHRAPAYGRVHSGRAATVAAMRGWAAGAGVPLVETAELIGEHVFGGHGNADGMHWGWEGHAVVGAAAAEVISQAIADGAI